MPRSDWQSMAFALWVLIFVPDVSLWVIVICENVHGAIKHELEVNSLKDHKTCEQLHLAAGHSRPRVWRRWWGQFEKRLQIISSNLSMFKIALIPIITQPPESTTVTILSLLETKVKSKKTSIFSKTEYKQSTSALLCLRFCRKFANAAYILKAW